MAGPHGRSMARAASGRISHAPLAAAAEVPLHGVSDCDCSSIILLGLSGTQCGVVPFVDTPDPSTLHSRFTITVVVEDVIAAVRAHSFDHPRIPARVARMSADGADNGG